MLNTSVALSVQVPPQPDISENDPLDPLWRLAGETRGVKALIVARQGLNLMCGLLRRGCRAATMLRPGGKPDADDYGLVVVPLISEQSSPEATIRAARRSLAPNGQLIAGVADFRASASLARWLRLNGFYAFQMTHLAGVVLLRADLRRSS